MLLCHLPEHVVCVLPICLVAEDGIEGPGRGKGLTKEHDCVGMPGNRDWCLVFTLEIRHLGKLGW